ncbi:MAG: hypothetical protein LBC97_16585 [Bifidobacteriaceae bacterium]|jgi:hypothetical protein|nr:hypothetical protein [Bifidobacteriaceae bacterium]
MGAINLSPDMSAVDLRRLRLLETIHEQVPDGRREVMFEGELAYPEVEDDADALIQAGLMYSQKRMTGRYGGAFIRREGRDFIAEVQRRRGHVVRRRQASRRALASWLIRQDDPAELHNTADFLAAPEATFYGERLAPQDAYTAAAWLEQQQCAKCITALGGDVARIGLTDQGQTWIENGGQQAGASMAIGTVNVTGNTFNGPAQIAGPRAVQAVVLATESDLAEVRKAIAAAEQAIFSLGLTDADTEIFRGQLADLATEANKAKPEWGRLRQLGKGIGGFLRDATAGGLGEVLAGLFLGLLARCIIPVGEGRGGQSPTQPARTLQAVPVSSSPLHSPRTLVQIAASPTVAGPRQQSSELLLSRSGHGARPVGRENSSSTTLRHLVSPLPTVPRPVLSSPPKGRGNGQDYPHWGEPSKSCIR